MGKLMFAFILQLAGFIAAVVALALKVPHEWFIAAFVVHVSGDILFVIEEGVPKMSFLNLLSEYVNLPAFLTFVGLMIAAGATFAMGHTFLRLVVFVGLGISLAGQLYEKIYK